MLIINIAPFELWDESLEKYITIHKEYTLQLEHSLISVHKWESKWCIPFLSKHTKTKEEIDDYIKCMTLNTVPDQVYMGLTNDAYDKVNQYINSPMTATTFSDTKKTSSREIITAELIYYWMISANIPFECRKWHLNKLLTLIRVCSIKNQPPKKRSSKSIMRDNHALNQARRQQFNTTG